MASSYDTALSRQPELSYVAPQSFHMNIEKLPQVHYNLQQVNIPPVNGGEVQLDNRFNSTRTFIPGDGVDYGQLSCTFLIDKYFETYRNIVDWIKQINVPEDGTQFQNLIDSQNSAEATTGFGKTMSNIDVYADGPDGKPLMIWNFINCFPISVDGPQYDASSTEVEYLTATVDFRFHYFTLQTVENGVISGVKI